MRGRRILLGAIAAVAGLLVSGCVSSGTRPEAIHHGAYAGVHGGHHR